MKLAIVIVLSVLAIAAVEGQNYRMAGDGKIVDDSSCKDLQIQALRNVAEASSLDQTRYLNQANAYGQLYQLGQSC